MRCGRCVATSVLRPVLRARPRSRHLFPSDMERQRAKPMDMIAALVGSLDQRALFQSLVTNSGRQHARFGVQPSQYAALGEALMWSLECKFGASFTPELRESWRALYAMVQVEMLRAAVQA
jgi:hemoglobin-like flavoprotein